MSKGRIIHISKFNWEELSFLSEAKDSRKFERNNKPIARNALFAPRNKEDIKLA